MAGLAKLRELARDWPKVRPIVVQGETVGYVRAISAADGLRVGAPPGAGFRLLALALCEEDGTPQWPIGTDAELEEAARELGGWPHGLVDACLAVVLELNGGEAVELLAGK